MVAESVHTIPSTDSVAVNYGGGYLANVAVETMGASPLHIYDGTDNTGEFIAAIAVGGGSGPTPTVNYTPTGGPLTISEFDAQIAPVGLVDPQTTYSTDSTNTILNTGSGTYGSIGCTTACVDSTVIVKFVASSSNDQLVLGSRFGSGVVEYAFNASTYFAFENYNGYNEFDTGSLSLTVGTTYYAKLDTLTLSPSETQFTFSILSLTGTVVFTKAVIDTTVALQGASGLSGVAASGPVGIEQIIIFAGEVSASITGGGGAPALQEPVVPIGRRFNVGLYFENTSGWTGTFGLG